MVCQPPRQQGSACFSAVYPCQSQLWSRSSAQQGWGNAVSPFLWQQEGPNSSSKVSEAQHEGNKFSETRECKEGNYRCVYDEEELEKTKCYMPHHLKAKTFVFKGLSWDFRHTQRPKQGILVLSFSRKDTLQPDLWPAGLHVVWKHCLSQPLRSPLEGPFRSTLSASSACCLAKSGFEDQPNSTMKFRDIIVDFKLEASGFFLVGINMVKSAIMSRRRTH